MRRPGASWTALAGLALALTACGGNSARDSTLLVSYFAQDTAFTSASPLRVSVGAGKAMHSLRGMELTNRYPFLMSGEMPLDSGATLPVTVVMLGATDDTLAQARLTFGPVEPATRYTVGVTVGGRNPAGASPCGVRVAVPLRREPVAHPDDSLYLSVIGIRNGGGC